MLRNRRMAGGKRHEDEEKGIERAFFLWGRNQTKPDDVYYHDFRQAAGKKKRMKPDTKTDRRLRFSPASSSVRSIPLMDGPRRDVLGLPRYVK